MHKLYYYIRLYVLFCFVYYVCLGDVRSLFAFAAHSLARAIERYPNGIENGNFAYICEINLTDSFN